MKQKKIYILVVCFLIIISIISVGEYSFERIVEVTYEEDNIICVTVFDGFDRSERKFEFNERSLPEPNSIELSVEKKYHENEDSEDYVYTTYDVPIYSLPVEFKDAGTNAFRLKADGLVVIDWQSLK